MLPTSRAPPPGSRPPRYRAGIERFDLDAADLADLLARGDAHRSLADPAGAVVVVAGDVARPVEVPADLPVVVVAGDRHASWADVTAGADEVDRLVDRIAAAPVAASALAVLLRSQPGRSVAEGLAAESAVYSALQAGPEFAAWRASRPVVRRPDHGPPVRADRHDDVLVVILDRPAVHNAFSSAMRDELEAVLAVARFDPSVARVELRGAGPSFCSGGDLDEFGSRPDPASAHLARLAASAGRAVHQIADRVTVHLHGAAMGSGIELAAFAHRVVAHPDTRIALPELGLGLIPGAGGTVSLVRRIGRQRTLELALAPHPIDATTALAWGLVDEVSTVSP
jgi:enoyl-CoA hydratase/carnithine racemase